MLLTASLARRGSSCRRFPHPTSVFPISTSIRQRQFISIRLSRVSPARPSCTACTALHSPTSPANPPVVRRLGVPITSPLCNRHLTCNRAILLYGRRGLRTKPSAAERRGSDDEIVEGHASIFSSILGIDDASATPQTSSVEQPQAEDAGDNPPGQPPVSGLGPENADDAIPFNSNHDNHEELRASQIGEDVVSVPRRRRCKISRRALKARRPSQPALILDAVHDRRQHQYLLTVPGKVDHSYANPRRVRSGLATHGHRRPHPTVTNLTAIEDTPATLYTILAGYVRATTMSPLGQAEFKLNEVESKIMESKGYSFQDLTLWGNCILSQDTHVATQVFRSDVSPPPLFLVLLFLRRKRISNSALGIIMRYVQRRLKTELIGWSSLKTLTIRLLRHARRIYPAALPWITSVFITEVARIYESAIKPANRASKPKLLGDVNHFCNRLLWLLYLPPSIHPMISTQHQEKAQFQVLHFMADCTPALPVTKVGFQAVASIQLSHEKTPQERDWASLKGQGWPPWKESRTSVDLDKGYQYGLSRASRILQQMYGAGHSGKTFADMIDLYAGWDTDRSPTIQTRIKLPFFSWPKTRLPSSLIWAARIDTTRTRREAWACFLNHESLNKTANAATYHAMFRKLVAREINENDTQQSSLRVESAGSPLLPGDVKEVWPDPDSPLHLVHIHEHVPSFEKLYHRMRSQGVRPTKTLLAFLLETVPSFELGLEILESVQEEYGGIMRELCDGTITAEDSTAIAPSYLLNAFIRFLCNFGRYDYSTIIPEYRTLPSRAEHQHRLRSDRGYRADYAYALLMHYKPLNRPVWTAFMHLLSRAKPNTSNTTTSSMPYKMLCNLMSTMQNLGLGLDEEQFQIVCLAARQVANRAFLGQFTRREDFDFVWTTLVHQRQLRVLFHDLVYAHADPSMPAMLQTTGLEPNPIPPQIPAPAVLHAYVRALGSLCDFEGLYSFSTWATAHHTEITARARQQRSGSQELVRTLVALRAALGGLLNTDQEKAPSELTELVKAQVEGVEEWGGWPDEHDVKDYIGVIPRKGKAMWYDE